MRRDIPALLLSYLLSKGVRVSRCSLILCFFAAVLNLTARGVALASDAQILTPRPGATVFARNPMAHLVLRIPGEEGRGRRVRLAKSGKLIDPVVSMEGDSARFLHFRLPLEPGKNSFTIVPGNQRLEFNFHPIQAQLYKKALGKNAFIFHQTDTLPELCQDCHDLQESETLHPVGLKKQIGCATCHKTIVDKGAYKHGPTVNEQCLVCHQRSVKPWRIGFPKGDVSDICLTCHTNEKKWLALKYRHGPMIGGCTLCHDPHGSDYRNQLWADGSLDICIDCHSDKQNLVRGKKQNRMKYVHNIIIGMGCIACHDPHATDNLFALKKPINALCTGCHQFLAGVTRGHPVARHPLSGRKDPRRPGRELACTGCHDPHGSPYANLLIQTPFGGKLCRECHNK